jgi:hypothetical protein
MLFIGMLDPEHPVLLSLNSDGCVRETGINIYPYEVPEGNVIYELVGLFVLINVNAETSPLVTVVPVNLPK